MVSERGARSASSTASIMPRRINAARYPPCGPRPARHVSETRPENEPSASRRTAVSRWNAVAMTARDNTGPVLLLFDIDGTLLLRASEAHASAVLQALTDVYGVEDPAAA